VFHVSEANAVVEEEVRRVVSHRHQHFMLNLRVGDPSQRGAAPGEENLPSNCLDVCRTQQALMSAVLSSESSSNSLVTSTP